MILVTGGCGYIGSHLVKLLSEAGESVVVYDNLSEGIEKNLLHHEPLVVGDITDPAKLQQVFAHYQIDTVVHLAALVNAAESVAKAQEYEAVNDHGSRNVWEQSQRAGVKHFLYSSSAAVYGNITSTEPVTEDHPQNPSNPYGSTKLAGEHSLLSVLRSEQNYLIFRFFNVGGAEPSGVLGQSLASRSIMQRLFDAALTHSPLVVNGSDYNTIDGTVVRDYVHVLDIVQTLAQGIVHLREGRDSAILNLGTGVPHTINQIIAEFEQLTNIRVPITYRDRSIGDIPYSLADISRARTLLGYAPTHTFSEIISSGYQSYLRRTKTAEHPQLVTNDQDSQL